MNSLAAVAKTKKLDRVYVKNVAELLRPLLKQRFDGNVTHMAKEMKVSQPSLQALMQGSERGVGIVFLLAVRDYLKDRTLDEILGLKPPELARISVLEETLERVLDRREADAQRKPVALLPAAQRSVR